MCLKTDWFKPNGWMQLSRLAYIHSRNLIYRDLKPENFVIGRRKLRKDQTIYVIDLGLAKEYRVNGSHIPLKTDRNITGTVPVSYTHLTLPTKRIV